MPSLEDDIPSDGEEHVGVVEDESSEEETDEEEELREDVERRQQFPELTEAGTSESVKRTPERDPREEGRSVKGRKSDSEIEDSQAEQKHENESDNVLEHPQGVGNKNSSMIQTMYHCWKSGTEPVPPGEERRFLKERRKYRMLC